VSGRIGDPDSPLRDVRAAALGMIATAGRAESGTGVAITWAANVKSVIMRTEGFISSDVLPVNTDWRY